MPLRRLAFAASLVALCACGEAKITPSGEPIDPYGALGKCTTSIECDDRVFCNGQETCEDGFCRPGNAVTCDDEWACTRNTCDETGDECVTTPNHELCGGRMCDPQLSVPGSDGCVDASRCQGDADCDDGVHCNGIETCGGNGACVAGRPVDCSDGDECTVDVCSEAERTCHRTGRDMDNDGYIDGTCARGDDCNDDDPSVNPGGREICTDAIDNDCDGRRNCDDDQCANSQTCRNQNNGNLGNNGGRNNGNNGNWGGGGGWDDGGGNWGDPWNGGAGRGVENCSDGIDNDGNRQTDCADRACVGRWPCNNGDRNGGRGNGNGLGDRNGGRGDPCANPNRYGDGTCDRNCQRRDPDCDNVPDRCRNLRSDGVCDEACRVQDPDCRNQNNQNRACGNVPREGVCDGDVLSVCENNRLRTTTCSQQAPAGTLECRRRDNGQRGFACLAKSTRPQGGGGDCGDLTWEGQCCASRSDCSRTGNFMQSCDIFAEPPKKEVVDCAASGRVCNPNGAFGAECTDPTIAGQNQRCDVDGRPGRIGTCTDNGARVEYCDPNTLVLRNEACTAGTRCGPLADGTNRCQTEAEEDCRLADGTIVDTWAGACEGERTLLECKQTNGRWSIQRTTCETGRVCRLERTESFGDYYDCLEPASTVDEFGESRAPAAWTEAGCYADWYSANDGCDCGCGVVDPDCDGDETVGGGCAPYGCTAPACVYCYGRPSGDCAADAENERPDNGVAPAGWTCRGDYYGDGSCDCECGAADSDCDLGCTSPDHDGCQTECEYCWGMFGDVNNRCTPYDENPGNANRPNGWTCDAAYYGDGTCDCECGVADSDCDFGCTSPDHDGCQTECLYCWGMFGDVNNECTPYNENPGNGNVPNGWTCEDSYYGDNSCDCECGVADSDCDFGCTSPDHDGCQTTCEYCWGMFGNGNGGCTAYNDDDGGGNTPAGWTCDDSYYGDGYCDCECGVADTDCDFGCTSPDHDGCQTECAYCWGMFGNGSGGCTAYDDDSGNNAPAGWTCTDSYYGDGSCDCECGVADSDCDFGCTSPDHDGCQTECAYCWGMFGNGSGGCTAYGGEGEGEGEGEGGCDDYDWSAYCVDCDGYDDSNDGCCGNDYEGADCNAGGEGEGEGEGESDCYESGWECWEHSDCCSGWCNDDWTCW